MFLVLWTEAIASDPDLRPVFAERDEAFRTSMAKAVAAGVADGTVRADADPDAAAIALVALMRGVGLQRLLSPDAVDLDAVRAEVGRLLQGGLAARSRGGHVPGSAGAAGAGVAVVAGSWAPPGRTRRRAAGRRRIACVRRGRPDRRRAR